MCRRLEHFELGQVVGTPGAMQALKANGLGFTDFLMRHSVGDWGDVPPEDKKANDHALKYGERILSSYPLPNGDKLWIITEWDRSVTTLLTPEEY